jgi:murein DD-endopeptidase MepM/ murein hydrolase activator NlpD
MIADRYGISVESLREYNQLDSNTIFSGDVLKVPYIASRGGFTETAPLPPPGFKLHTLARGETISQIISHYDLSIEALVGANPDLSSLDQLPAGLELLIPPSEGLVIALEAGQTLHDIVAIYGVDPIELAKTNNIRSPADVQAGQLLFLPNVPPIASLDRLARVSVVETQARIEAAENRYVWPLHGRLTSYFGRRNLGMGTSSFHTGLDIAAPHGTPVVAARGGTVIFAAYQGSYGYLVKIRHRDGVETWYAHHSALLVSVGDLVEQGDIIARVGSTGLSTGPHLHFEVRQGGRAFDPFNYLN